MNIFKQSLLAAILAGMSISNVLADTHADVDDLTMDVLENHDLHEVAHEIELPDQASDEAREHIGDGHENRHDDATEEAEHAAEEATEAANEAAEEATEANEAAEEATEAANEAAEEATEAANEAAEEAAEATHEAGDS